MNNNTKQAFTLIELMLAVMLTAMVIVVASAATRSILKTKRLVNDQEYSVSQALVVIDKISEDLENIFREKVNGQFYFKATKNGGTNNEYDRMIFYRIAESFSGTSLTNINEIEYGLLKNENNEEGYKLGSRVAAVTDTAIGNSNGKVTVLADAVRSFMLEYWDGLVWSRSVANGSIPIMVRITLELDTSIWATGSSIISKQVSLLPIPEDIDNYEIPKK